MNLRPGDCDSRHFDTIAFLLKQRAFLACGKVPNMGMQRCGGCAEPSRGCEKLNSSAMTTAESFNSIGVNSDIRPIPNLLMLTSRNPNVRFFPVDLSSVHCSTPIHGQDSNAVEGADEAGIVEFMLEPGATVARAMLTVEESARLQSSRSFCEPWFRNLKAPEPSYYVRAPQWSEIAADVLVAAGIRNMTTGPNLSLAVVH